MRTSAYFFIYSCYIETEKRANTQTHFDFQGGSLQLFRDLHTDTHPGLSSLKTMAAPVLSSAPSRCLCSASPHCCPASVSMSGCVCVCYNRRERGWGLSRKPGQLHCVCQLQVSRSLCVALHVCDPQRGFPLHWVSTSLCLWPSSVCHSVSTSTLTLQLSGMFSAHRVTIAALNVFLRKLPRKIFTLQDAH